MSSHPPAQQTPPAPATATGADQARVAEEARRRASKGYDFSKTIVAPPLTAMPAGTKSTLG